jgi:hypothetical protein
MGQVKVEAFMSNPPAPDDIQLTQILERIQTKFGEKMLIIVSGKDDSLFKTYHLTRTPAVVIGEMIKFMGFCPSEESIISAINDLGI